MNSKNKKEVKEVDNINKIEWYYIIPLILAIAFVPLIVYLKVIPLTGDIKNVWTSETNFDFFSYYKMVSLAILSILSIISLVICIKNKKIELKRMFVFYPMIVYSIFVLLSTILSLQPEMALYGCPDRYEGFIALISYIILCFASINLVKNEKSINIIIGALFISSTIICILGFFQYIGYDLFRSSWAYRLYIPGEYSYLDEKLTFNFGTGTIYGTLCNPNYVGSYMSILLPLSGIILLLTKNRTIKIITALLTILNFIILFGCNSRGGFIAVLLSLIILAIFIRKILYKNLKYVLIGLVLIITLTIIFKFPIIGKIYDTVKDITGKTSNFCYLKDVIIDNDKVNIITRDNPLRIVYTDNKLLFIDKNNIVINLNFIVYPAVFKFENKAYEDYMITLSKNYINIERTEIGGFKFSLVNIDGKFKFVHKDKFIDLPNIEKWGFEGKEQIGSQRLYILSRSLPLLLSTIIIGYGPDTFIMYFPQNDYIGKIIAYGKQEMLVDKAHNMYLQTAINTGIISLLALLVIFIYYIAISVKLYIKNNFDDYYSIAGFSIFISIISYLICGLFNDSVVSVAPVFWILLGTGISINLKLLEDKKNTETTI